VVLSPADAQRFCDGQKIRVDSGRPDSAGLVRVYAEGRRFAGIGQLDDSGGLAPRRIFR